MPSHSIFQVFSRKSHVTAARGPLSRLLRLPATMFVIAQSEG